jgi:hypothetical protein
MLNKNIAQNQEQFKNFTGSEGFFQGGGEDWANLFGSKKRKQSLARSRDEETEKWKLVQETTCKQVASKLTQLDIRIQGLNEELDASPKDVFIPQRISVAKQIQSALLIKQINMNCAALEEAAAAAANVSPAPTLPSGSSATPTTSTTTSTTTLALSGGLGGPGGGPGGALVKTDVIPSSEVATDSSSVPTLPNGLQALVSNKDNMQKYLLYGAIGLVAILLLTRKN